MTTIFRIVACFSLVLIFRPTWAETYTYSEYIVPLEGIELPDGASTVISETGYILAGGHYPAKFCSESSQYHCIQSAPLTFVVPKGRVNVGLTWHYEGADFSVVREYADFSILGEMAHAYLIERKLEEDLRLLFLFSPCRGLLAFGSEVGGDGQLGFTTWLESRRGLFANSRCDP